MVRHGFEDHGEGPVAVDDATRLACAEVLADARKATTTAFPLRALRWFRAQGIGARRVMTDNGSACRSRRFAEALRLLGLRHIFTRPCTPRTNGKAERFIQTLMRAWADGVPYPSSQARDGGLPRWLDGFNRSRPHAARNRLSPLEAVNNLMRTHSWRSPPILGKGSGCDTMNLKRRMSCCPPLVRGQWRMMTDDRMALLEPVEQRADGELLREMLAFAAERIMEAEVEARTGAAKGARTLMREVQRNG
jgi:hypothetical protein